MRHASTLPTLVAVQALGLLAAACTGPSGQGPAWELEERPGLLLPITQHYERYAIEESGRCKDMLLEGVTQSSIVAEELDGSLMVNLRYSYRSTSTISRNARNRRRRCVGFGEREFEVSRNGDGYRVVSMTGEQRGQRQ